MSPLVTHWCRACSRRDEKGEVVADVCRGFPSTIFCSEESVRVWGVLKGLSAEPSSRRDCAQWFAPRDDFAPRRHLAMLGNLF